MNNLITERDVRAAVKTGTLVVPDAALVTPAARDLAKSLGVALATAHVADGQTQSETVPNTVRRLHTGNKNLTSHGKYGTGARWGDLQTRQK